MLAKKGGGPWVLGDGSQRVAPVFRDDVVEAIVAALDLGTNHGRFDLPGPDEMTMDEFVGIVNGGRVRPRHLPALLARTLGHALPGLTPELVEIMLEDSIGDQIRAVRTFGLQRRGPMDMYGLRTAIVA